MTRLRRWAGVDDDVVVVVVCFTVAGPTIYVRARGVFRDGRTEEGERGWGWGEEGRRWGVVLMAMDLMVDVAVEFCSCVDCTTMVDTRDVR